MKRDHGDVVGTGKNMWGLQVRFFKCDYKLKSRK